MNDDETPGERSASGRLWTQPREEDEHTQWLAPRTAVQPAPPSTADLGEPTEPDEPERPPQRLAPLVLLGVLLACALFGAGILGATVLLQDDVKAASSAALPAASGAVAPDAR